MQFSSLLALFFFTSFSLYSKDSLSNTSSSTSSNHDSLNFTPCHVQTQSTIIDAQCATLHRPENPAEVDGKTIALSVIKLPAFRKNPAADAFTLIQGGPGGSSIDLATQAKPLLDMVRQQRDVLILDQRGTGRSNALHCPESTEDSSALFDPALVKSYVESCLAEIEQRGNDVRFYTTSVAVQDIEALRKLSGYPQLTLYGVSYGTRVAQHYLRQYPNATRAVILDGVVPMGVSLAGDEVAKNAQTALDALFKRCADDADCAKQFPNLKQQFTKLRSSLAQQPVTLTQAHPTTGKQTQVTINETMLLGTIRLMKYSTLSQALIPLMIAQAHAGDYTLLAAQGMQQTSALLESLAMGMNNSVICAEDFPFVEAPNAALSAQYYLKDDQRQRMHTTCEIWPQGVLDEGFNLPFTSDIPALILSGETDPVTPPHYADMAHGMLKNSAHIVTPFHAHGVFLQGCIPNIINHFIQDLDLSVADNACVQREIATPFFISNTGATP